MSPSEALPAHPRQPDPTRAHCRNGEEQCHGCACCVKAASVGLMRLLWRCCCCGVSATTVRQREGHTYCSGDCFQTATVVAGGTVYYRDCVITYEPKPIPTTSCDFGWAHDDYDGAPIDSEDGYAADSRSGYAGSVAACKAEIDAMHEASS